MKSNQKTADPVFDHPRLVQVYDAFDPDRLDLVPYVSLAKQYKAQTVVDLGCGTGVLALILVEKGINVTAVDPARNSLAMAQSKTGAERVQWVHGDSQDIPKTKTGMLFMTGNTAQAIIRDEDWKAMLGNVKKALRKDGLFVFETRNPEFEGWKEWTKELSYQKIHIPVVGTVETWVDLIEAELPHVSFRWTWIFHEDGARLTSVSRIRFRSRSEVEKDLTEAGFELVDVREAPDRPGKEMVFLAKSTN